MLMKRLINIPGENNWYKKVWRRVCRGARAVLYTPSKEIILNKEIFLALIKYPPSSFEKSYRKKQPTR